MRCSAIAHRNEYNGFRGSICVTGLELIQSSPGSRGYMRQTGFAGLTPARLIAGLGECLSNVTHAFLVNECTITIQSANTV